MFFPAALFHNYNRGAHQPGKPRAGKINLPARYPVHVINEHIRNKTDSHPDKREDDQGSRIEDRAIARESIFDPRSSILDPLRSRRFFVVDFDCFRASLTAIRTTPKKHRDRGRKSPEPEHRSVTLGPGHPERGRQNKTLVLKPERARTGRKNHYQVDSADRNMWQQIKSLS